MTVLLFMIIEIINIRGNKVGKTNIIKTKAKVRLHNKLANLVSKSLKKQGCTISKSLGNGTL